MSATKSLIPRPDVAELHRLYVDQGLGCPEIARRFGRDGKTVFWWLRKAGIQTRPRGSNPGPQFKKGEPGAFTGRKHSRATRQKLRDACLSDGRVPYLRNGQHWMKGLPPSANGRWKGGVTPERQEFYRSQEWKVACRAVWVRANGCCERCELDFRTVDRRRDGAFHIHHIASFAVRALRAEVTNLALLCRPCHLFVHNAANTKREFLAVESNEEAETA